MKKYFPVLLALAATWPWLVLRLAGGHDNPLVVALLSGVAILGAAFLLSWASEVAQLEISAALAVAILSLIAVLPEYAVDIYFAWQAGQDPTYARYTVANMTGANRLLIGIGWSLVIIFHWWKSKNSVLHFEKRDALELGALIVATAYAFVIPAKGTLSLLDSVLLIALFIFYARATSKQEPEEPELVGPALALAILPRRARRGITLGFFIFAAAVILLSAEPFANGLVETGRIAGVNEFFLVQWLAPLASEAPEFIVAALFTLRGRALLGIRTMISSKVNQWTLLVGMIPVAYALSSNSLAPLILDELQVQEVLLTAAQSAFAIAILSKLDFSVTAAVTLMALFLTQFFLPQYHLVFSFLYLGLALFLLASSRQRWRGIREALDDMMHP